MLNILSICLVGMLPAQEQNNQWRFGFGSAVDFNTTPPTCSLGASLPTLSPPYLSGSYIEGTASVADRNTGALLFYTDGWTIWDAQDQPMPNGTGLDGSTYLSSLGGAVIVPIPQSCTRYYVFTVGDQEEGFEGVKYSVVDMTLNSGLGDVVPGLKGIPLYQNRSEMLNVVVNAAQDGYWLLTCDYQSQVLAAFAVSASGVSTTPVLSPLSFPAFFRANRQGTKMVVNEGLGIKLVDLDAATGQVSNPVNIPLLVPGGDQLKYFEFSPGGQYLYATSDLFFYQLDVSSNDAATILASAVIIPVPLGNGMYGQVQLGPDGKLYVVAAYGVRVIDNPDDPASMFTSFGQLPTVSTMVCLPQLIDALPLVAPQGSISPNADECAGDGLPFSFTSNTPVVSIAWDFGDTASAADNTSTLLQPTHAFYAPGSYTVTAVVTFACTTDTFSLPLTILDCNVPDTLTIASEQANCALDTVAFSIRTNLLIEDIIGWDFGDPASGPANTSILGAPTHVYAEAGTYAVSCIVQVNCSEPPTPDDPITTPCFYLDTLFTTVSLLDCGPVDTRCIVHVPNAFTPNADGINDTFGPVVACALKDYRFLVFNRWGQEVHTASRPDNVWDGNFRGTDCPEGVYAYTVQYRGPAGAMVRASGHVTLVR